MSAPLCNAPNAVPTTMVLPNAAAPTAVPATVATAFAPPTTTSSPAPTAFPKSPLSLLKSGSSLSQWSLFGEQQAYETAKIQRQAKKNTAKEQHMGRSGTPMSPTSPTSSPTERSEKLIKRIQSIVPKLGDKVVVASGLTITDLVAYVKVKSARTGW